MKYIFLFVLLTKLTTASAVTFLSDEQERDLKQQQFMLQQTIDQKQMELGRQQMQEMQQIGTQRPITFSQPESATKYQELQNLREQQDLFRQ